MKIKRDDIGAFRASVENCISLARDLIEAEGTRLTREAYLNDDPAGLIGTGVVYVFFEKKQGVLFVGETSMALRAREKKYPSPYTDEAWWPRWTEVLLIPNSVRFERELFERLLVVAYAPKYLNGKRTMPRQPLFS